MFSFYGNFLKVCDVDDVRTSDTNPQWHLNALLSRHPQLSPECGDGVGL